MSRLAIAGAALVASLGLNAYLLRGVYRDAAAVRAQSAKVAPPREHEPPRATDEACHAELDRCRAEGWKLLGTIVTQHAPRGDAGDVGGPRVASGGGSTAPRQREALCAIAREHLRAHWKSEKETLTRNVAADLADRDKQAEEARKTAAQMADTLGLTPAQADELAADYLHVYSDHTAVLLAALGRDPPDYAAVLGEVKGLYADEDAMIGRLEGDGAVELWRAQELQGRTAIVAIAATLADAPWDDAIVW